MGRRARRARARRSHPAGRPSAAPSGSASCLRARPCRRARARPDRTPPAAASVRRRWWRAAVNARTDPARSAATRAEREHDRQRGHRSWQGHEAGSIATPGRESSRSSSRRSRPQAAGAGALPLREHDDDRRVARNQDGDGRPRRVREDPVARQAAVLIGVDRRVRVTLAHAARAVPPLMFSVTFASLLRLVLVIMTAMSPFAWTDACVLSAAPNGPRLHRLHHLVAAARQEVRDLRAVVAPARRVVAPS